MDDKSIQESHGDSSDHRNQSCTSGEILFIHRYLKHTTEKSVHISPRFFAKSLLRNEVDQLFLGVFKSSHMKNPQRKSLCCSACECSAGDQLNQDSVDAPVLDEADHARSGSIGYILSEQIVIRWIIHYLRDDYWLREPMFIFQTKSTGLFYWLIDRILSIEI